MTGHIFEFAELASSSPALLTTTTISSTMSAARLLRGQLGTSAGSSSFHLSVRKLVIEYCEASASSRGARGYVRTLPSVASTTRTVEFVARQRPGAHPVLRAMYANGRSKEVCVKSLEANAVAAKATQLLHASGEKIKPLKRRPVVSTTESARGIWSVLHDLPSKV